MPITFDKSMDGYRVVVLDLNGEKGKPEEVLARHLRRLLGALHLDCQVKEEEAYGLPENSICLGYDVRSFCGRWTYGRAESFNQGVCTTVSFLTKMW